MGCLVHVRVRFLSAIGILRSGIFFLKAIGRLISGKDKSSKSLEGSDGLPDEELEGEISVGPSLGKSDWISAGETIGSVIPW
jgi:hypothetical protein